LEYECLKRLSGTDFGSKTDPSESSPAVIVRTPKHYHLDADNTNLFLECMPQGMTLLNYVPKHYASSNSWASTPEAEAAARKIGKAAGTWLRGFCQWSADHDAELHDHAARGALGQMFRQLTFTWLKDRAEQDPDIVDDEAKDIFEKVEQMTIAELANPDKLQLVHGDFWTGK
jgi:hypothetical protein